VSSTDHPVPGRDEAGGEPGPAAASSRARQARYGCWPWAGGVVLAGSQVVVVVLATGAWRTVGAVVLAAVTVVGIAFAAFGGEE
jgi:hypothetical protein